MMGVASYDSSRAEREAVNLCAAVDICFFFLLANSPFSLAYLLLRREYKVH